MLDFSDLHMSDFLIIKLIDSKVSVYLSEYNMHSVQLQIWCDSKTHSIVLEYNVIHIDYAIVERVARTVRLFHVKNPSLYIKREFFKKRMWVFANN